MIPRREGRKNIRSRHGESGRRFEFAVLFPLIRVIRDWLSNNSLCHGCHWHGFIDVPPPFFIREIRAYMNIHRSSSINRDESIVEGRESVNSRMIGTYARYFGNIVHSFGNFLAITRVLGNIL